MGDIAQAAPKEKEVRRGMEILKKIFSFVTDATSEGRYLRAGYGQDLSRAVNGMIEFRDLNNMDGSVKTKRSPVYSLASGVRTEWGRLEGEFSYRENEIEHFNFKQPTEPIEVEGGLTTYALMVNLFFQGEFKPIEEKEFIISPYVLGGLGGSYLEYTEKNLLDALGLNEDKSEYKEGKLNFAYQGGAGVRFPIGGKGEGVTREGFSFDVSYRFFGAPEMKFDLMKDRKEARSVEFKNDHHAWMVGIVYDF